MTERVTFVEIDLRRCSNTYSDSPCTAALGVTGTKKCFNSFGTCQDTPNFTDETVTVRYSNSSSALPDINAIPNIDSVSIRPAKLELGESIGIRASININFKDSRYPDTGPEGDRYLADRDYDPYTQGTYWGKFRARFPFVRGSNIRLIRGTTDQTLAQMETRHFIVDGVAGPNSDGTFTVQCKDALNLAKGKQAQAPLLSTGTTTFGLSDVATNVLLEPAGVGNLEYPSSGLVNVGGKELCTFTRSGDNMTIVRGTNNTEAISHSAGVRIQLCLDYQIQRVVNIIQDLLENYASIDPALIPFFDWGLESDTYIDRNYSGIIAEPTAVDKLINELLVQTASNIWWDDINQLIQFRVLRAVDSDAATYTDDVIVSDSFSAKDQPNKRVSQVWTYYGQINPLEKLDEVQNYSTTIVTVSPESEADFDGEKSIRTIFSRWIPIGSDAASRLNDLILSRYTTPPRLVSFGLQRDVSLIDPTLGGGYNCSSFTLQTDEGATEVVPVQLLQVKSSDSGFNVIGEEVLYSQTIIPDDPTTKNIPIDTSQTNIDLFAYAINAGFTFSTGDTANFNIYSGVIVGSSSTGAPSMITGAEETGVGIGDGWPSGITLNVINGGKIIGKGGAGGAGGAVFDNGSAFTGAGDGVIGSNGGPAIVFNYNAAITNDGVIGGGGGGSGGGGASGILGFAFSVSGSGGGGGAGESFGGLSGVNELAIYEYSSEGNNGGGGSILSGGEGGVSAFVITPSVFGTVSGGKGGAGGELGLDGDQGDQGQRSGAAAGEDGAGGAGGLAGSAIDKSGFTVVITNNGTIAGDINA